jgi:hypothetical protein
MAFTQTDVALLETKIRAAIADGSWQVQTIQFSDQSLTIRSLNEAMDLLGRMRALATGSIRTRYASTDKDV